MTYNLVLMKTFTPVTGAIQRVTQSLGLGRLPDSRRQHPTTPDWCVPLFLFVLCAALMVQPCLANPFEWEFTGSMNHPRAYHTATNTATLLYDGRVLVAGGAGPRPGAFPFPGLASAELYNPATGNWTATGNLNDGRLLHTATLLSDGRVLVAGGWPDHTDRGPLSSAELYNPFTGNWTRTVGMHVVRVGHTAT